MSRDTHFLLRRLSRALRVASSPSLSPLRILSPEADLVRRRWKAVATATGDSDSVAGERALRAFYEACDAPVPERIVWADSPQQLAQMGSERSEGALWHPSVFLFAENRDHPIVRDWVAALEAFRRVGFRGLYADDYPPLRERAAWSTIVKQLRRECGEYQWHRLEKLLFNLHSSPGNADNPWEVTLPDDFLEAAYILDLAQEIAGLELSSYTQAAVALAGETAGWWIAGTKTGFLLRHPEVFECDRSGNLHCEDGPAVRWRDGTTIYTHESAR